jgi:hypothetical protein
MDPGAMQMPEIKRLFLAASAIILALTAAPALADPWARPGDLALRHDIQLLSDAGVLKSPITAWPIPWATIAADLASGPAPDTLAPDVLIARERLMRRLDRVRRLQGLQPNARVALRTDSFWLRNFEDTPRDGEEMRAGVSWMGDRFAARAQVSFVPDPTFETDREWRADGSYLAGVFGNHILYAGALDQWWGPSHDDTLILSSNARPVGGLGLQRSVALPFEHRWLSWLGPWTYSLFWGFLESDREVPDARLIAFRFGFRPLDDLEIGLTRTAQWCGQGRPCDADALWDIIIGDSNVSDREAAIDEDPGNQLAAIDFRWQSPFGNGPWAIYGQGAAEDEAGGFPSRYFGQAGFETWGTVDTRLFSGSWRAHFEYTNTLVHFWQEEPRYKTAYEHSFYQSGYRYYGRSLGAAADRDSQLFSLGLTLVDAEARSWNGLLRFAEINNQGGGLGKDLRHSVSPEELQVFSAQLSHRRTISYRDLDLGAIGVGFGVQYSDNQITGESETDVQAFIQWAWDYSGL